jgi:hypothetical protein
VCIWCERTSYELIASLTKYCTVSHTELSPGAVPRVLHDYSDTCYDVSVSQQPVASLSSLVTQQLVAAGFYHNHLYVVDLLFQLRQFQQIVTAAAATAADCQTS